MIWLGIALAGGLGAIARFLVSQALLARTTAPAGTIVVNLSGAGAAGAIAGLLAGGLLTEQVAIVVAGGFLGAYTTFSTAMYETLQLRARSGWFAAGTLVLGESLAALATAAGGWWLVTRLV